MEKDKQNSKIKNNKNRKNLQNYFNNEKNYSNELKRIKKTENNEGKLLYKFNNIDNSSINILNNEILDCLMKYSVYDLDNIDYTTNEDIILK